LMWEVTMKVIQERGKIIVGEGGRIIVKKF
jgi:hypothetical protein